MANIQLECSTGTYLGLISGEGFQMSLEFFSMELAYNVYKNLIYVSNKVNFFFLNSGTKNIFYVEVNPVVR